MTISRKTNALVPETRKKICDHPHAPFRGHIPCTGPRVCMMCGQLFENGYELAAARQEARYAKKWEEQPQRVT